MPKTFALYSRFEKGINTRIDDADIGAESLAEADGWSVNTLGEINTMNKMLSNLLLDVAQGSSPHTKDPRGSGYGMIKCESDYDFNHVTNLTGAYKTTGTSLLFFGDKYGAITCINDVENTASVRGLIGKFYEEAPSVTSGYDVSFLWHEGELRWANTKHDSANRVKWMGYFDRDRFVADDDDNDHNRLSGRWIITNATVLKPVRPDQSNNGNGNLYPVTDITTKYPNTSADMPNFSYQLTTNSEKGTWAAADYEFGMTYIYRKDQESLVTPLKVYVGNTAQDYLNIPKRQYLTHLNCAFKNENGTILDERMTGCRLYARKYNGGRRWRLVLDVDFSRGSRLNTFDLFQNSWSHTTNQYYHLNSYLERRDPSVETFEALNGIMNDEHKISFEDASHGWGHAKAVGRRIFYVGVKYYDEVTPKVMRDRVFYSQPAKPDVVPVSNWIDLGINDGDQFVTLESFGGNLCLFKRNKVYILNVQAGNPAGWGLVQEIDNNGVPYPSNVTNTRYGIVWANRYGCFMYGGQGVMELSSPIDPSTWLNTFDGVDKFILGMNNVKNQLVVQATGRTTPSSNTEGIWMYNFDSQGWSRFKDSAYDYNDGFFNDREGKLYYFTHQNYKYISPEIKIDEDGETTYQKTFKLKEDTLGSPGVMKRFYNVKVELKNEANANLTVLFNGSGAISKTLTSANTDYVTKIFTPVNGVGNPTPIESDRMQLTFKSNSVGGVTISNIVLEYRTKRLRISES